MQVFQKKVKDFSYEEKTKASSFINFLIKTCVLSVYFKDQKIKFSVVKCLFYLIVAMIPSALYYFYMKESFAAYMKMSDTLNKARYHLSNLINVVMKIF